MDQIRRKQVMVVDDEDFMLRYLDSNLSPYYQLYYAKSGTEALQLVLETKPDLVLMDICMPGLDGLDTCRLLKNAPETCHIPVLMMSGMDRMQDEVHALDAGADAFVSKPLHVQQVHSLIDDLLFSYVHK
ncbi:response regulator [Rheinheimera sp.]|uniref:response regulator n=1 Tax=Rheinheimera sp. TaxID=1869214 RepID=UPI003AF7EA01